MAGMALMRALTTTLGRREGGKQVTHREPNKRAIFPAGTQWAGRDLQGYFVFTLNIPLPAHSELYFLL